MYRQLLVVFIIAAASCLGLPKMEHPRRNNRQGRIVGGEVAQIKNFPYQVQVEYGGTFACSASIINDNWVVTVAHCVERFDPGRVQVRAGTGERSNGGELHAASTIIVNPNYDPSHNYDGDVALIKVTPPFVYGPVVQPIALIATEPKVGEMATVSGWGAQLDGDILSPVLRFVTVPIVDRPTCQTDYSKRGGITANMICAGLEQGGKDACTGDLGGALVVGGKLAGLVSFGFGCADPNYPGVYANIATLRDFILSKTSK